MKLCQHFCKLVCQLGVYLTVFSYEVVKIFLIVGNHAYIIGRFLRKLSNPSLYMYLGLTSILLTFISFQFIIHNSKLSIVNCQLSTFNFQFSIPHRLTILHQRHLVFDFSIGEGIEGLTVLLFGLEKVAHC